MKEQKETKGLKFFWARDEKEFYSLIEEKLEEEGFEVFETSRRLSRESETLFF